MTGDANRPRRSRSGDGTTGHQRLEAIGLRADLVETRDADEPLSLDVQAHGPTEFEAAALRAALIRHPLVQRALEGAEYHLNAFRIDDDGSKRGSSCAPDRFVATIVDYTNGRTLQLSGPLAALDEGAPGEIDLADVADDPVPSPEEFANAVDIVRHDRELRARIEAGQVVPYQPMPPTVSIEMPDGRIERTVAVGLRAARDATFDHRVVGANLFSRGLLDIEDFQWPGLDPCEPPPANDSCPSTGSTGQVTVAVWQGGQKIWDFVVVRPAASSGLNGSGVELRHVNYRGKSVLYRAHVPILNIQYVAGAGCGPTYRDWQREEACFEANGTDVIPGIRLCSSPARTILESGSDAGNFRGVAIYVDGQDVVLVSEMQAGWYRYMSEWRLRSDGTIRPRFGFSAIDNPCTCNEHIHHVYWRFDFDIRTAWNNVVQEHNDPPIIAGTNWHTKTYEIRRPRDASRNRYWRVSNAGSGEGYDLVPGPDDGVSDAYGVGDLWVLRYHGNELDDGQGFTTDPARSIAKLDAFRSPAELVAGTDVVLWYAAHFRHDRAHESGEWLGPLLRPVRW